MLDDTIHNWTFFNGGFPPLTTEIKSEQWIRVLAGYKNKTSANTNYVFIVDMPNAVKCSYSNNSVVAWKELTSDLSKYSGTPFGEWCLASHALRKYRTAWNTYYKSHQAHPAPCEEDDIPMYGYGTSRDNGGKCHSSIQFAIKPNVNANDFPVKTHHPIIMYEHQLGVPKIIISKFG